MIFLIWTEMCSVPNYQSWFTFFRFEHLLCEGQISSQVWNFFCNSRGIKQVHGQLRMSAMNWRNAEGKNDVHEYILQCLPIAICWEIWKNRWKARFDDKRMSTWYIIQQANNLISLILKNQYPELPFPNSWIEKMWYMLDKLKPIIHSKVVF